MPRQEAIWEEGIRVASALEAAGHEAYLVGGCVRDRLLGRELHDIDIATSALPEQVVALFPKVVPTGLPHGTVTVLSGEFGFEVTTFRHETSYSDSRHPDKVAFVRDVKEDLARRDFTINAIAYGTNGFLIDPFGGQEDLKRRIVRCVGAAGERFGEDALRMLRGIRFAAEFDFEIDEEAWRGIHSQRERLKRIAMERVGTELDKMLAGRHPSKAIRLLRTSGLLAHAKESLYPPLPAIEGTEAGWHRLERVELRWAAVLLLAGADSAQADDWLRKLKFSSRRVAEVSAIAALRGYLGESRKPIDRERWTAAVLRFGVKSAADYIAIARAFPYADRSQWDPGDGIEQADVWLREMPAATVKELAVRGDELGRLLGREAGPWISEELNRLLLLVALNKLKNEAQALKAESKRHWTEKNA